MLVDLKWTNPDPERIINWDDKDGSLKLTFVDGEERFDYTVAVRVHCGIYASFNFDNHIRMFNKEYEVLFVGDEWRTIWAEMVKAEEEDKDKYRQKLRSMPQEYGRADTLQQILKRGRHFVRRPEPVVLEVRWYDNTNEKRHKAGGYIGKHDPEPDEVLAFNWYLLKVKG